MILYPIYRTVSTSRQVRNWHRMIVKMISSNEQRSHIRSLMLEDAVTALQLHKNISIPFDKSPAFSRITKTSFNLAQTLSQRLLWSMKVCSAGMLWCFWTQWSLSIPLRLLFIYNKIMTISSLFCGTISNSVLGSCQILCSIIITWPLNCLSISI